MNTRELILNQFEPQVVPPLIEFGKSLGRIDADVLVFMARKSLCLYDILLRIGIPPVEKCLVSDRILDMKLSPIVGKKVALIDDTVIIGTSLAKAKRRLEREAQAQVSVHVFAVDQTWWNSDILNPDSIGISMPHDGIMTFCTSEVRALSLAPRPYLVDFPLAQPVRVKEGDLSALLSCIEWSAYKISTRLQESHDVGVYTFFPSDQIISELVDGVGTQVADCLDIVKVRVFSRTIKDVNWLQVIPLVTLKPLSEDNLALLLRMMVKRLSLKSDINLEKLVEFANTPQSQQRLTQYIFSAALGQRFNQSLKQCIQSNIEFKYDEREADRHYGPWLHDEMNQIGLHAYRGLWSKRKVKGGALPIRPSQIPHSERTEGQAFLRAAYSSNDLSKGNVNLLAAFSEVFNDLYDKKEIPAREAARSYNNHSIGSDDDLSGHSRLEKGLPWELIVSHLCHRHHIMDSPAVGRVFSLVLDLCNDLGIAVPVTYVAEGVVFRAYRYGEDVKFSDGELLLSYEAVSGLLKATKQEAVPHLVLEKLLVLLIQIGAAKRFLIPLYGISGVEGVASVGFHLQGAIPMFAEGPKDRAGRNTWLSNYLLERGVLKRTADKKYMLGHKIEGNLMTSDADHQAYELGQIVGMLMRSAQDEQRMSAPLDSKALTVLATCCHPRHVAAALQVELDILRSWWENVGARELSSVSWYHSGSLRDRLRFLLHSHGYQAVHSAKFKYCSHINGDHDTIVNSCTAFLESNLQVDLPARQWSKYWQALKSADGVGEADKFSPLIDRAAVMVWGAAICLSAIELSLLVGLRKLNEVRSERLGTAQRKLCTFNEGMERASLSLPDYATKVSGQIGAFDIARIEEFDERQVFVETIEQLSQQMLGIANLVEALEPVIEEFGRAASRRDYAYLLWYDIIDSTATNAGRKGCDVSINRTRTNNFKRAITSQLHALTISAKKKSCEIYCWNGDLDSSNDEKHIFFQGNFSRHYLKHTLEMLIDISNVHDVHLRLYIVPCNFAGTGAYRYAKDSEVSGERFWEHFSRLRRIGRGFEESYPASSFLLVGDAGLITQMDTSNIKWSDTQENVIESEIELLMKRTIVRYGAAATILRSTSQSALPL